MKTRFFYAKLSSFVYRINIDGTVDLKMSKRDKWRESSLTPEVFDSVANNFIELPEELVINHI